MTRYAIVSISILLTICIFGGVVFGVLRKEELKRQMENIIAREEFLTRLEETDSARRAYFESVQKKKEEFRVQMEESKQQYEQLLKDQPNLVANQEQTVTRTVNQTVPVTSIQTVTRPKSTKTTKSS